MRGQMTSNVTVDELSFSARTWVVGHVNCSVLTYHLSSSDCGDPDPSMAEPAMPMHT